MKKLLSACAPFCLLLPHTGIAQDLIELDEIVVSATIEPQPINRTGAIVDIVNEEELVNAPLSIANALDRVVGTSVSANGGVGANTTLRVRGLDGKYIGVRIDGIDVTDPSSTQTQFNFGGLTSAGVGRIEIVKGSQSALYGSEAVAGVIDISTLSLSEDGRRTQVGIEAGSFGTVNASVGHAMRDGATALSFNLSRTETDGFSARASDTEADGFSQTLLTVKGETEVGEGVTIGASALYRDTSIEIDRSSFDPSGETTGEQRGARAFTAFDAFGVEHELSVSKFETERRDPGGFVTEFDGDRTQITYLGTTDLAFGTLSFGLDRTEETFLTSSNSGESTTNSAMLELLTQPSNTTDLALSLRYDNNDTFGGNVSGRVALAWQATSETTVRAVVGNGFRAPSLFERFSAFGDPALAVEKSSSAELGVERQFSNGNYEATLFYTRVVDLIDFDGLAVACGSGFGCYNQVAGKTVSMGLELGGEVEVADGLTLFGSYAFTDAETEGTRLARVPRHDLSIGIERDFSDSFSVFASVTHVADIEPSAFAPADNKVDDHTLVSIGASYGISDTTEAYFRVENLFDEDYETAGGFNTAGRSFFAGIRAQF